jgi:hypothetical protein
MQWGPSSGLGLVANSMLPQLSLPHWSSPLSTSLLCTPLLLCHAASDGGEDEDEDMEGHEEARGDIGTDDDEVGP